MPYFTIARHFFSFDRWLGVEPLGNGHINDTYLIRFDKGGIVQQYVLQRLNHHIFKQPQALMLNIRKVSDYLVKQDYPYQVVGPVPTITGDLLLEDEAGNYWRVFPFVPNSYTPEALVSADIAFQAARAYGAFARALREFPASTLVETIPGFHDTDRRWEVLEAVIKENPAGRVHLAQTEIGVIQESRSVFEAVSDLKKSGALPLRVTHNDTKAGNILFDKKNNKALAVIDLDTVMPGTILSDFGDMVRTFAPDKPEDDPEAVRIQPEIVAALQEGFLSETADWLLASERQHLMLGAAWMAGEQALRFLTDWLAGDVYYKTHDSEHNLVRTKNQLSLFRSIIKDYH